MKTHSQSISHRFTRMAALVLMACALPLLAQETLFDDLEAGGNQNKFLGYWYFYTDVDDGGNSTIANAEPSGDELLFTGDYGEGRDGSANAAIVDYAFGDVEPSCGGTCTYGNFVGVGSEFAPQGSVLDMTTATSITFWMKGSEADMTVRVEVATADIEDFGYYRILAAVGTEWEQHTIDFTDILTFTQPSWADPVDFNPAQVEKIQWSISAEDVNPATGKLWIDDIVVNGFVWVPPTACPGISGPGEGTGAVLTDMEDEEAPNQNALGEYWYAFNDAEGRTVAPGEFTDVFGGVTVDPVDPTVIDIAIDGNGYESTNGAWIEFQLGPSYQQDGNTIQPFAGVGTKLSDNLGLSFYNADNDQATGVYFDYKTEGVDWLTFEVHANQEFPNEGIVHHCLAQGIDGAWRGANVPFDSLKLPDWEEVRNMPAAQKVLKTTALEKLQWSFHGSQGTEASITIDNVHLVGAASINPVEGSYARRHFINLSLLKGNMVFHLNENFRDVNLSIMGANGKTLFQNSFDNLSEALTVDTKAYSPGVYYVNFEGRTRNGQEVSYRKPVSLLN